MSAFATVELTVYPYECDAFGHLNQAALLTLLERARWDALARGPGMDLFERNGVWPAARKAVIEYEAAALARDVLRIETTLVHRGTTSITLRHAVHRVADDVLIATADMVFVCIDRIGRATPIPEEIARFLGPRPQAAHQPIRVSGAGGDVELAVDVRGEGVPVVFVHGFPLDRTVWRHQLAALSRVKRIAFDLRGVGGSSPPTAADGYSLTRYADDVVAVLDALGIRAAVVCGLSLGGYITFELLRRHPERVRALILADTKADADGAEAKRARDELAVVAEQQGPASVIEQLLPRLVSPTTLATQPEVVAQVREMAERWSAASLTGALRVLRDRPDSTATLRAVRVPTLVFGGQDDAISPPRATKAIAALVPGAQYQVIPAAGHLAPLEQPLATGRLLADFLGGLA